MSDDSLRKALNGMVESIPTHNPYHATVERLLRMYEFSPAKNGEVVCQHLALILQCLLPPRTQQTPWQQRVQRLWDYTGLQGYLRSLPEVIVTMLRFVPEDQALLRGRLFALHQSATFSAPEAMGTWWMEGARIFQELFPKPDKLNDWQKEVISVWMNKTFPLSADTADI